MYCHPLHPLLSHWYARSTNPCPQEKLGISPGPQQDAVVQDMVRSFVEGICWVMAYYYDGVASWTWYYPYHYAPFASDMHSIAGMQPTFTLGEPFKPFNQLMGVLPAASSHCLPKVGGVCGCVWMGVWGRAPSRYHALERHGGRSSLSMDVHRLLYPSTA